jgi:hypothetical protein
MLALGVPAALGILVALLVGGSLTAWHTVHVRGWPVAAACLLVQVVLFGPVIQDQPVIVAWGPWLYLLSLLGIISVLVANARGPRAVRASLGIAAVGVALNCLVIVANGGYMPRSIQAAASLGKASATVSDHLVNVQPMSPETRLPWLGDVLAQPRWLPTANIVSIGDVLLSAGIACWAFTITSTRRRPCDPVRSTSS